MPDPSHVRHLLQRLPSLLVLALLAWVPAIVFTLAVVVLGGVDALRSNVFATVVASHVAMVVGFALAVPAMFRVLHADASLRAAVRDAARWRGWALNSSLGLIAVPV
ncbi:MAG TPA: hypothetical protein VM364_13605, partial [Vicinamibacterales bacterium]|nr:hypothetical protein [Vicinamibacterales bacterium]